MSTPSTAEWFPILVRELLSTGNSAIGFIYKEWIYRQFSLPVDTPSAHGITLNVRLLRFLALY